MLKSSSLNVGEFQVEVCPFKQEHEMHILAGKTNNEHFSSRISEKNWDAFVACAAGT